MDSVTPIDARPQGSDACFGPGRGVDVVEATERLATELSRTAVERDRVGGHAAEQRAAIRASGLLGLAVPTRFGGLGADWPTVYRTVRRLAIVDSALAHVLSFHHLQIASVLLYGDGDQQHRLLRATIEDGLFWGNALNPLDARLVATPADGCWRLDGSKRYASGSVGSDRLTLSARVVPADGSAPQLLIGTVPTRSPGLEVHEDWDSFGQRQTDSGTIRFEAVFLPVRDVLQAPGTVPPPRSTLRQLVSQLTMANLYLGIGQGAFEAARAYTVEHARPWIQSQVPRSADDPFVQHRYGDLWLRVRAAELAAEAAAVQLQAAIDRGDALRPDERGAVAIAVAEAKVLAHRAGVEVSSQVFELTGAASTSTRLGLDRFWRNARVHTLHDPVDYKLRDIGRYRIDGRIPEPGPYT